MRSLLTILISFSLLSFFSACNKTKVDFDNYAPVVKTTSVELLEDGSVKVTGEIISDGVDDLVMVGFCMDTIPNPHLLSNQKHTDTLMGNKFSCIYPALDDKHTYYFKAWAANMQVYATGEVLRLDSVFVKVVEAPCTPPLDSIIATNAQRTKKEFFSDISELEENFDNWKLTARVYTSISELEISFLKPPVNGVYETVKNLTSHKPSVVVKYDGWTVDEGAEVYVKKLGAKEIEISVCSAYVYNGFVKDNITFRIRTTIQ